MGLPIHPRAPARVRPINLSPLDQKMNPISPSNLFLALVLAGTVNLGHAQTTDSATAGSPTRMQVRMETKEFLKTHRWDEPTEVWVLKSGVEPPTGVVSRATVKAKRDEYMRLNQWDAVSDTWSARKPVPATPSTLTREQVRADTIAFTRTHHWDEEVEAWVLNTPRRTKQ
jgi:hypothetical protein